MVATAIRTDIHRPSAPEFDPEAYRLVDVYDLHVESGDHRFLAQEQDRLAAQGIVRGGNLTAGCGHCGQSNLRYVALLVRDDVREWIFVGEDCLAGRFAGQTKAGFAKLRKDAELDRAKQRVKAAWLALCDANPGLAYASYAGDIIDAYVSAVSDPRDAVHLAAGAGWALSTLDDIARKARRNGDASAKQVAFVERLWAEIDQKLAAHATRQDAQDVEPPAAPAPEGRVRIEGEVVSAKWYENGFGGAVKLTVKGDAGWRVWVTQPSNLDADKGDRVRLTATVTRSDDDPGFAFGKRPAGAEILARAAD